MGIVFNSKVGGSYINKPSCKEAISLQSVRKGLTSQNVIFLKQLGLRVIPYGERRRKNDP